MYLTTSYYKAEEFKLGPRISWIQSDKIDIPPISNENRESQVVLSKQQFFWDIVLFITPAPKVYDNGFSIVGLTNF